MRTIYPYGLNESASDKETDSSFLHPAVGKLYPPLPRSSRSVRSRGNRNNHSSNLSSAEFFQSVDDLIQNDLHNSFFEIRKILDLTKKKVLKEIPYSYKFSRGQIFAHFVCAKINYFRADLFSRTFKMINFCADKISRTSFFSTSKTLKFTPKSAVLWRKLFHIVLKIFARINFRAPVQNLRKFGTYFRAISRKIGLCAKMRENLYARKLVRIR